MLYKALNKIKNIIVIAKFDDVKILINIYNKLINYITYVVILMTCIINDDGKFYSNNFIRITNIFR